MACGLRTAASCGPEDEGEWAKIDRTRGMKGEIEQPYPSYGARPKAGVGVDTGRFVI